MDKEGSSPARRSRDSRSLDTRSLVPDRWIPGRWFWVAGYQVSGPGRWFRVTGYQIAGYQVAGARSLAQRSATCTG
ncbi:UNVERIFIED_CONTAM: hypothetical protein Slati_2409800 [Sesamum latifolium]|uniref:Uncharacterized protein n=1 Tax=Sesamum latifolium TaxID=2727402 RepID=A0AAW2WCD2_9LAMI